VPAADYPAFCRKLADELRQVPDLRTGQPLVSEVWTRDEIFQGPHGHVAPDLTLVLRDGGLVSILPSTEAVSRRPVVSGAHRYRGIFGARGPGLRCGLDAGELSILDIAPTVLYSLGVPLPEDLQGRVPREIFQEGILEKQPVRKVAAHAAETTNHAPVSAEMEDEETVLDRLRELGYIE
jgi:predicted AlkP superfamily phosphohydrolase/phosphomutase